VQNIENRDFVAPIPPFLLNRKALGGDPGAFVFIHCIQYSGLELTKFKVDVYAR
jgi:hypothetical protein